MPSRSPLPGAAMGLLVLTTRLAAQTLPMPASPQPVPEAVPETARPRPWEYALGAGVGWDGNMDFLVPDGPSGLAVVPRGGLARIFSGPRAQLRASAAGSWTGHAGREERRRYDADLSLEGRYDPSPATQWRGSASYGLGYSDSSTILQQQGVSVPVVRTRSLAGALGLSRRTGARGSLRLDGRFYRTEFDSPGLIDGSSLRGTVGLERRLGSRSTAAVEYSLEHVRPDQEGSSHLTHFGSFQWTRVLSQRSVLLLEAGASYTPDAARAGLDSSQGFFGGASFTRQLRRSTLTLFVRREVAPAFGTSVSRLALRTGLQASVPMGRAWELRMLALHIEPESTRDAELADARSDDAFMAVSRRVGRRLEVSAEARYRRRGATEALPAVAAFRAGLFVTVLGPSGRPLPRPGF
jgi:putative beta-barrel porin BBP2